MSTQEATVAVPSVDKKKKKNRTRLEFAAIQDGIYGTHPKDFKGSVLVHNRTEAEKLGIRKACIDETNFETQLLIYTTSGEKATGGYKVVVGRVFQDNETGDLLIKAMDKKPKDCQFSTMALTYPFVVVRVAKPGKAAGKLKIKWQKPAKKEE